MKIDIYPKFNHESRRHEIKMRFYKNNEDVKAHLIKEMDIIERQFEYDLETSKYFGGMIDSLMSLIENCINNIFEQYEKDILDQLKRIEKIREMNNVQQ